MAAPAGGGGGRREGASATKSAVAEQISQAVLSTSNLLRLMNASSAAQAQLAKLPSNLLAKASVAKTTGHSLQQLPHIISTLDAYTDHCLQSASHMEPVTLLLSNMESTQLRSIRPLYQQQEERHDSSITK